MIPQCLLQSLSVCTIVQGGPLPRSLSVLLKKEFACEGAKGQRNGQVRRNRVVTEIIETAVLWALKAV